jgi:glycerophosphoryl diester phosphodiesterase
MREWLTARPIAHRGLHDDAAGVIENTVSAFNAAIAGGYAIECDLQISADGEAMVFHDDELDRLTDGRGAVETMTAAELKRIAFKRTPDRMITLGELCGLVAGRTTLVIELKSRFDGDRRLADRTASVLAGYAGPVAVMSFDPEPIAAVRKAAPALPRGLVAMRRAADDPAREASALGYAWHLLAAWPQFLAYQVSDLTALPPLLARHVLRIPVLTWTVRTVEHRARAARYADQMIFEGFRPGN